ncbi:hypothetical protein Taro_017669 [Colocasia esculenta]|uniref:Retrotransposon gag domain-containing protein n=1 Tax=Colocasia esculenta TaxID=4460 RepID=A0A843UNP7_COLES|nr:hypothetical protein [Colocasia esculenta]
MEQNQPAHPVQGEGSVRQLEKAQDDQDEAEAPNQQRAPPAMSTSHAGAPPAVVGTPAPVVKQTDNVQPATPVAAVGNVGKADLVDRFTAESAPFSRSESLFDPRWKDDLREMNRKIEALQLGTRAPCVATLLTSSPFTEEVTSAPVPPKFQLLKFRRYNGTTNPVHHLDHFQGQVEMINITDALKCRAFMSTLDDAALQWFKALPARSVSDFSDLAQRFLDHFFNTVQHSLCTDDLWLVSQKENEMFRDYAKRFQIEVMKVVDLDLRTTVNILTRVCIDVSFMASVAKKPPVSLSDLLSRMQKYVRLESTLGAAGRLKRPLERGNASSETSEKRPRREEARGDRHRDSENRRMSDRRPDEYRRVRDLPRFRRPPSEILPIIKKLPEFRRPEPITRPPSGRGAELYCEYHKCFGHLTDQCRSLKMEISEMLRRGIIGKDVVNGKPKDREQEGDREREGKGAVLVLAGGSAGGGDSGRKRKAYASAVVLGINQPSLEPITFSADDAMGLSFPHDDALVIHADIDGYTVHRILVDNGAAPDVLFYDCFLKMTNLSTELRPVATPLFGFSGTPVTAEGSIRLKVTLGTRPRHVTVEVDFLIVKVKSAYNAIFGRGLLGKLGGVPSTYHQKLKFPTPFGVGEVVGSQAEARLCYVNSIKAKEPAISEYVPTVDDAPKHEPSAKYIPTDEDYRVHEERQLLLIQNDISCLVERTINGRLQGLVHDGSELLASAPCDLVAALAISSENRS